MFKGIRRKIISLFVLMIIAVEIIIGTAVIICAINYFHNDFRSAVNSVFTSELKESLTTSAITPALPEDYPGADASAISETAAVKQLSSILNSVSGELSLSSSRFYAILDSTASTVLATSGSEMQITATDALLAAMNGTETIKSGFFLSVMDYALPITDGNNIKYIIYVKDTGDAQHALTLAMLRILLYALAGSVLLALIAANLLSASVTQPLRVLTIKAKKLADGDINALSPSDTKDEIGALTNSLLSLAHTRQASTDAAKGEKLKVETILQNMSDGVLAFDMQGKLIHVNPEACRLLHRNYLDDINFDRFFKEINADISMGDLVYMKPDGALEREIRLDDQFLQLGFASFTVDGKISGIIVVIHDITRQEKLEQSRREFVANVSHELRTPLTTIKSYSETLADMPTADRELQTRFLDVIAGEADRMANIISDLLTLSQLDDNHSYLKEPESIDIRKMLESLVDRMGLQAKKKKQTLVYRSINEVPIIKGDYGSLERVFTNIISNALKYTPEGGTIEVFSSRVYSDITVKVKDNGIGIQKEKLPHIFDRFYRVDKARTRDTGGTGLGLAIAKQSIESQFRGKIKITSEYSKGTEVTVTIPASEV